MLEETVATYLAVASVVRTPEGVAIPTACDAFPGAAIAKVFANQEPPHQLRDTRARWPPLPDGDHQWHRCCDGGGGEGRLCDHCRSGAFLLVGLGRVPQFSQLLRGKLRAGGRKPWLATTFGTLLASP
ncbi:MAG: hypothetical protein QOD02_1938 [Mycobacterium sp.]|jgi:hypothetical protein|nr:hypothetical protein [Mycobacterium sp.]MDT5251627.1 hypothetical protein [Mycobacterium sp.]